MPIKAKYIVRRAPARTLLALFSSFALSACVLAVDSDGDADMEFGWDYNYPHVGAIYDADVGDDQIVIRVKSGGCTVKDDFDVDVDREGNVYEVAFHRDRRDKCEAHVPDGYEIAYSFDELDIPSGAAVKIRNAVKPPN